MSTYVVGVDGCKSGWISAAFDAGRREFAFATHANFSSLSASYADASSIAVDIPIGLSESCSARRCDLIARRMIGPRSSSIFPAPDRRLLPFASYSEASAFSRQHCGKGLTKQSFAIFKKIAEVDAAMSAEVQSRVFEVHPEVCFFAAAGRHHLLHPKRKPAGFDERRAILDQAFTGIMLPTRPEAARLKPGAGADDVLDAIVAAWTALRHQQGLSEQIPQPPEFDARGLRMEMVF